MWVLVSSNQWLNSPYLCAQDAWPRMVRAAWHIDPAIAVHMGERFKIPLVHSEISRIVKLAPRAVVDVPEALQYLLGIELQRDALPAIRVSLASI